MNRVEICKGKWNFELVWFHFRSYSDSFCISGRSECGWKQKKAMTSLSDFFYTLAFILSNLESDVTQAPRQFHFWFRSDLRLRVIIPNECLVKVQEAWGAYLLLTLSYFGRNIRRGIILTIELGLIKLCNILKDTLKAFDDLKNKQYTIHWDKTQMLKKFPSHKNKCYKK